MNYLPDVVSMAVGCMTALLITVLFCATYLYGPAVRERLKTRSSVSPELLALDRELDRKAAKPERKRP